MQLCSRRGCGRVTLVGRSSFTRAEVDELRRLVREKQTADASRQKALRARMRRMDFYISDFAADPGGFVVSDLDELSAAAPSRSSRAARPRRRQRMAPDSA
jgi:hypothetical protein